MMIVLAFKEMASNAQKIGELNVSPDLLRTLLSGAPAIPAAAPQPKVK